MGDRVSFDEEGYWDKREGTIVGFVNTESRGIVAVIRTASGSYTSLPIDSIKYVG